MGNVIVATVPVILVEKSRVRDGSLHSLNMGKIPLIDAELVTVPVLPVARPSRVKPIGLRQ